MLKVAQWFYSLADYIRTQSKKFTVEVYTCKILKYSRCCQEHIEVKRGVAYDKQNVT